jgi:hypothetical protein
LRRRIRPNRKAAGAVVRAGAREPRARGAGQHADDARDAVDKERKRREDDLKKLEKAIGVKSPF